MHTIHVFIQDHGQLYVILRPSVRGFCEDVIANM